MRNFIKFLATLFVLAMLPFAILYVLEIYITDYSAVKVVETQGFHIVYVMYAVVCLFILGIDYSINSRKE